MAEAGLGEDFPQLDELMAMRGGEFDDFKFVCDNFLPCIVGKVIWKDEASNRPVSEFASISDEALCLLTLENYYEYWKAKCDWLVEEEGRKEIDYEADPKNKNAPVPKYTGCGGNEAQPKKRGGWCDEGMQRFNDIFDDVVQDREEHEDVEQQYMKYRVETFGDGGKQKKRQKAAVPEKRTRPKFG